jgi:Sec-independent protein translocase protein TatA
MIGKEHRMGLELTSLSSRMNVALERKSVAAEGAVSSSETDQQALRDSLRVSLSELGKARSAAAQKNRDIDESSLPDVLKDLLKMIRELKAQIEAKKAELKEVMSDQSLDPETKRMKIEALQGELASLQGALSSANATLIKTMREQDLSDQQMQEMASLVMK